MKIAAVQMDVALGECEENLQKILSLLEESRANGATLTIFPECALTGYCFRDVDEAKPHAQSVPGSATDAIVEKLKELGGYAVVGMLEEQGEGVVNAAVLMNGDGVIGSYHKIHLPHLGVDQFSEYGTEPFKVYEIDGVRVGLAICYDSAFPESMRAMAIQGADLIALPTNFPTGAEPMTEFVIRTRAMENNVYFACVNRVGEERGFRFIGGSQIVGPNGVVMTLWPEENEQILYAEIDPEKARNKRIVRKPGEHAIDRLADRRPEMYGDLTASHDLKRPRDD